EGQGKNPPSYVQYDFDEHSWTDDGLYMLDDDGHTAIQMPSGGLVKKDRPEEESEAQLVVVGAEENIIEVPSDESAELDINIADDDSTLIRTIEEKPLTAEEADQIGFATDISNDIVEDTNSPADESLMPLEFPSDPVAWAQYVLEHKDRIVVLDTETTTWSNDPACEVVQLGIADMDGHQLLNVRIKPSKGSVSDGAARIHGITNTMLKDEKTLPHYLEQIRNAIQGKYIIAYNAPFDKEALARAFTNADLDPISVAGWQCAMRTYSRHNPNKVSRGRKGGWWKLVEAVEQQRMTAREDAHDALADVLMTIDLIQSMAQDSAHRWKNKVGYIPGDLVAVKATEVHFEIVKTMPNGELNMRDVQDASYQTMAASMIKLITRVQDRPALTEPLEPETLILEADSQVDESDSTLTEPEVVTIQPIQKSANPLATDKFERMIAGMGSREEALMLIEYITAVIDHVHPEPA
ncbi:MAG: 3'-5' exonuclease, partial [Chloroflexota bacterium]